MSLSFFIATVLLGVDIRMGVLEVPHVVGAFCDSSTDRAWKVVWTRNGANVFGDICGDEILACAAPPTSVFMPCQVSLDWLSAPFAEGKTNLIWCDDDILKNNLQYTS